MGLELFNKRSRPQLFQRLSGEQFDLLIIGGGITGASIFRDAALRGMRVALLEADDFAAGASGRSSKLIHGGLRYLKNFRFRLAWESCHERNLHIRLNKRLVQPWPFLLPLYSSSGESVTALYAGMWLYEIMSGFRNYRVHRAIGRKETLLIAPGLSSERLIGGILYYDAIVSDNRWTLETVKDGVRNGGIAINHAPVTGFIKNNNKVVGVVYHDQINNTAYEARANVVVNAAGAWVDQVRRLDRPEVSNLVKLSKGTHLVFAEADVPLTVSTVLFSPLDRRPLFMIKRKGCFLFGTTDNWEDADPNIPTPGRNDVEYLLNSLRQSLPDANLDRTKIQFVYSGFRALPVDENQSVSPSAATREDIIEVSPSGLVTVVGGKLTTARIMAIRVLKKVSDIIGRSRIWLPCQTHKLSIGGDNEQIAGELAYWERQCPRLVSYFRFLYKRYGLDASGICAEAIKSFHDFGTNPGIKAILPELIYMCRNEMACTLEDLIERRAGFLHWSNEKRLERLRQAANIIQDELDMTEAEFEQKYHDYREHLKRLHTIPE